MRSSLRSFLTAGGAILAAAALTPALAGGGLVHVLTIPLPGGVVEQVQYTGDVAPNVVLVPSAEAAAAPVAAFDPFVSLERISALMDKQLAVLMRQADAMPAMMMPELPRGSTGYSLATTMSGDGVCTRSVRITYSGGTAAPKMVSSTSGNCGPDRGAAARVEINRPIPTPRPVMPHTIEARAISPTQVALNH